MRVEVMLEAEVDPGEPLGVSPLDACRNDDGVDRVLYGRDHGRNDCGTWGSELPRLLLQVI